MNPTLSSQPVLYGFCEQDQALLAGVWLELMASTEEPEARCRQLYSYAQVLMAQGRAEDATIRLQDCIEVAARAGLQACLNQARTLLGQLPVQPAEGH